MSRSRRCLVALFLCLIPYCAYSGDEKGGEGCGRRVIRKMPFQIEDGFYVSMVRVDPRVDEDKLLAGITLEINGMVEIDGLRLEQGSGANSYVFFPKVPSRTRRNRDTREVFGIWSTAAGLEDDCRENAIRLKVFLKHTAIEAIAQSKSEVTTVIWPIPKFKNSLEIQMNSVAEPGQARPGETLAFAEMRLGTGINFKTIAVVKGNGKLYVRYPPGNVLGRNQEMFKPTKLYEQFFSDQILAYYKEYFGE